MEKLSFNFKPPQLNEHNEQVLANGQVRPYSLDMDIEFRAFRCIGFKQLAREEIENVQRWEIANMYGRFILPHEVRKLLEREYNPACTQDQMSWMISFCVKHKPNPTQPDIDHDGMRLHHAWDWTVWHRDWTLPSGKMDAKSEQLARIR